MARYATEHKQRTRRRIVDAAGRRLKSSGLTGSGVATLMADAGLTNGALYAHFASKDELVARVVTDQLDDSAMRSPNPVSSRWCGPPVGRAPRSPC